MTLDEYLTDLNRRADAKGAARVTDAAFGVLAGGLSQSQVSRLRRRESRPSWGTMEAIEKASGGKVTASATDWPAKMIEAAE